jgi:exonuclease III
MSDTPNIHPRLLTIWQQNVNASNVAQQHCLKTMKDHQVDVAIIQEPYIDFHSSSRTNQFWHPVYPKRHSRQFDKTCSLILVNSHLHTNSWTPIDCDCPDITAIHIHGEYGILEIFNIYNDCTHSNTLKILETYMQYREAQVTAEELPTHFLWAVDFNRHHEAWDEPRNHHPFTGPNTIAAEELINLTAEYGLRMVLPPGIPTLQSFAMKNWTRVDNVFVSDTFTDRIVACNMVPESQPVKSDHLPIITSIDIAKIQVDDTPWLNYRATDWPEFNKVLVTRLSHIPPAAVISTMDDFNTALRNLTAAIADATAAVVPVSRPCPYSKRWWTKKLTTMKQQTQMLGRRSHRTANECDPVHEAY